GSGLRFQLWTWGRAIPGRVLRFKLRGQHLKTPSEIRPFRNRPVVVFVQLSRLVESWCRSLGPCPRRRIPRHAVHDPQAGPVFHVETLLDARALARLHHAPDLRGIEFIVDERDRPKAQRRRYVLRSARAVRSLATRHLPPAA